MNNKETGQVKKIRTKNFVYISIMILILAMVIVAFFYSAKFIIRNINKVFTTNYNEQIHVLDIPNYSLVQKKLNLPVNMPEENTLEENTLESTNIDQSIASEEKLEIVEIIDNGINKEDLKINILNGARKAGVASNMSKKISELGFKNITVGDSKIVYPLTTIFIKDTAIPFQGEIEETVRKIYVKSTTKTNPENSDFDIVIIIGKQ